MDKPKNLPLALECAKEYIQKLKSAGVPYSITPDYCEKSEEPVGFNIGVDAARSDQFSVWVVLNFRESGLNSLGFVNRGTIIEEFEPSSYSFGEMAKNFAQCRAGSKKFEVTTNHGSLKILKFSHNYGF